MRAAKSPGSIGALILGLLWVDLVSAQAQTNVITYHNDNSRTGQNIGETVLTTANVNSNQFGKLYSVSVDGYVYAQPLVVTNVNIPGLGTHNVVYVATMKDSLYAIDADNGSVLWQQSFVNPSGGTTAVPGTETQCGNIAPTLGITSTPVIDVSGGTIYLVAFTKEKNAYVQRLHAIDIATHAEKFGGPVEIKATISGIGSGSVSGTVSFETGKSNQRAGLLLQNSHVVIAWGSYCDHSPYHGWVMSYNAATLAQEAVLLTTPDGSGGGVWMSGAGLAADAGSHIYFGTGNGDYDGSSNLGDSVLKVNGPTGGSFPLSDWFTPYNQAYMNTKDQDVSSGGVLLLPDLPSGSAHPQLLVAVGKTGTMYLINRNNMGQYCSGCTSDTQIVQEIPSAVGGMWGMPAYWNGNVYLGGRGDKLKAFSFNANNSGLLSRSLTSESSQVFGFPGPTASVSADGNRNGIVWALDNSAYSSSCCQVLHAYNATDLATELYNSGQAPNSRDVPGGAVKFTVPTVANGKVYVGSQASLSIYGLLVQAAATPVFSPVGGTYSSAQSVSISDSSSGAKIYYTTNGSTPTTSSSVYTGPITVSTTTTIKAIAAGAGFTTSAVASATYIIQQTAATPVFSPVGGTYSSAQSVSISDSSSGAKIYYTTDGSTPTTSSSVYTGPIAVSTTTTIKAIAAGGGFTASAVISGTYSIQQAAATPVFSPVGGTYSSAQSVSISDSSSGAKIYYTTDGSTPTTSSSVYTGPIAVSTTTTIKAIAAGGGFTASAVISGTYSIQQAAATPVFSPVGGTYSSAQSVSISDSSSGAKIYYTTDGSTPTTSSSVYTGPIAVSTTTTIKAIAAGGGFTASAVISGTYSIQQAAATPVFSPVGGTYSSAQSVSISDSSSGAKIYYTTDGSTPTTSSSVYTGPIAVSTTTTIKAIAAGGGFLTSAVASVTYAIQAGPAFSPAPGDIRVQGDFDGDGKLDYAVWRPSNGTWYVSESSNPGFVVQRQWGVPGDVPVAGSYDEVGKTEFAVWRPSEGTWYILSSKTGLPYTVQWGLSGDIPIPGDFDGDGKTDLAVWRPSDQTWHIILSGDPTRAFDYQWGLPGDIPVSGDFDKSGKQEIAVWRPSNGTWYIVSGTTGAQLTRQWGLPGDVPVPADYDGDGITDYAVWRPSNENLYIVPSNNRGAPYMQRVNSPRNILATKFDVGGLGAGVYIYVNGDFDGDGQLDFAVWRLSDATWFVVPSSTPTAPITHQWGLPGDVPVPGAFTTAHGAADFVVWRPSNGTWYIRPSNGGTTFQVQWGLPGDIPVLGDFAGDGLVDCAVWRPSNGTWYIRPSNGGTTSQVQWGLPGDIPAPGDFTTTNGATDLAVWRPSNGTWYIIPSDGSARYTKQWGLPGDVPVAGNFEGSGLTDYAVWRPSESNWYVLPNNINGAPHVERLGVTPGIPICNEPR